MWSKVKDEGSIEQQSRAPIRGSRDTCCLASLSCQVYCRRIVALLLLVTQKVVVWPSKTSTNLSDRQGSSLLCDQHRRPPLFQDPMDSTLLAAFQAQTAADPGFPLVERGHSIWTRAMINNSAFQLANSAPTLPAGALVAMQCANGPEFIAALIGLRTLNAAILFGRCLHSRSRGRAPRNRLRLLSEAHERRSQQGHCLAMVYAPAIGPLPLHRQDHRGHQCSRGQVDLRFQLDNHAGSW